MDPDLTSCLPHCENASCLPRGRRSARIRVLVAHRSPMVAAGIGAALRRLPSCVVKVAPPPDDRAQVEHGDDAHLVFGDASAVAAIRARAKEPARDDGGYIPKVVLVTIGEVAQADPSGACKPDACISIDCAERELMDTVERLAARRADKPRGGLAPGVLRKVREHVEARLSQPIAVDDMAAIAGLSPCHFGRAFKQSLGVPPHRYVMERRIEAAARLINDSGRKLAEIALDVGFCDQSHFSRLFASHRGMTPLEFRRANS